MVLSKFSDVYLYRKGAKYYTCKVFSLLIPVHLEYWENTERIFYIYLLVINQELYLKKPASRSSPQLYTRVGLGKFIYLVELFDACPLSKTMYVMVI